MLKIKWLNEAPFQTFCRGSLKIIGFPPSIPPKTPRKQRYQREKLHPAENHQEHEDPFGGDGEEDVGMAWSHQPDTRTHIAQGGHRSTNGGVEVDTREEQDDAASDKHQEIDEDKGDVFVDTAGGDGFFIDFHG